MSTRDFYRHIDDNIYSPSGNVLGILAGAATVGVADLEDGADRATVLPGDALETYVILSAVLRMGVSAEAAGCAAHFAGGRTRETTGNLCALIGIRREREKERRGKALFLVISLPIGRELTGRGALDAEIAQSKKETN